jgi:hypothetical protein
MRSASSYASWAAHDDLLRRSRARCRTLSGFVVDRYGPRPVLFAGSALLAVAAFGFARQHELVDAGVFSVVAGSGNGVVPPGRLHAAQPKGAPSRLGHAFSVHGITGSLGWAWRRPCWCRSRMRLLARRAALRRRAACSS